MFSVDPDFTWGAVYLVVTLVVLRYWYHGRSFIFEGCLRRFAG